MNEQEAEPFVEAAHDINFASWLPYLGLRQPHPLAGIESEDLTDAKEIFEFFKTTYPKESFKSFLKFLNTLPSIPGLNEKKVKQVLNSLRLVKLASKGKFVA